jgi:hypothetical protein
MAVSFKLSRTVGASRDAGGGAGTGVSAFNGGEACGAETTLYLGEVRVFVRRW